MEWQDLISLATVLAVSSILIATFFLVNDTLKEIAVKSDYKVANVLLEVSIDNLTAYTLQPRIIGSYEFACINNETGTNIPSVFSGATANYTLTNSRSPESTSSVLSAGSNNYSANCTYNSTDFSSSVWKNLNASESGVGEFTDWIDIVVVAAMASLILGLVLGLFMLRSSRKVE